MKTNKGITLVALVVTIVVLLILAGVSISLVLGQNGLITQAQEAKKKTAEATKNEENEISSMSNYVYNETKSLPQTAETKPYYPSNEFKKVEGTDLSNGLVIEDASGNQYVWVEVPMTEEVYKTTKLNVTEFDEEVYGKIEEDLHQYTMAYRKGKSTKETEFKDIYAEDSSDGWFKNEEEYNTKKYKMLKSVYQNGGFWIGRYEAGIAKNRINGDEIPLEIPQSKENLYPYTFVTRTQTKVLAEKLKYGEYTGSVLFGVQWDLTEAFIHNKGNVSDELINDDSKKIGNYLNSSFKINRGSYTVITNEQLSRWYNFNEDVKSIVENSTRIGNAEIIFTTGASDKNSQMNIYDMAGNVWEWTLEYTDAFSLGPCAGRGGAYHLYGDHIPQSGRYGNTVMYSSKSIGFRVSIY